MLSDNGVQDIEAYLKRVDMKMVVEKLAFAWDGITPTSIRNSWNRLIPPGNVPNHSSSSSDNAPDNTDLSGSTEELHEDETFTEDFAALGYDLNEDDIQEWLRINMHDQGYEHLNDEGILAHVQGQNDAESDSDLEESEPPPSCSVKQSSRYV